MPDDVTVAPDQQSSVYHYGEYSHPAADQLVDRAIDRMADQEPDPIAAACNLLIRWMEQDDTVRAAFPDIVRAYVEQRVRFRAESSTIPDSPQ